MHLWRFNNKKEELLPIEDLGAGVDFPDSEAFKVDSCTDVAFRGLANPLMRIGPGNTGTGLIVLTSTGTGLIVLTSTGTGLIVLTAKTRINFHF